MLTFNSTFYARSSHHGGMQILTVDLVVNLGMTRSFCTGAYPLEVCVLWIECYNLQLISQIVKDVNDNNVGRYILLMFNNPHENIHVLNFCCLTEQQKT